MDSQLLLVASRLTGTMLAQALLVPAAMLIVWVAQVTGFVIMPLLIQPIESSGHADCH
jgi:hypothetical protein